ncbi:hypothetical protein [Spirosoma litoris]
MIRLHIFCLLVSLPAFCQVRVIDQFDSTGSIAPSPFSTKTHLLKAGVGLPLFRQSSVSPAWKVIGLDASYEKIIWSGLVVSAGLETNYGFGPGSQLFTVEMPLALKYYLPIWKKKQLASNKSIFFNPYIAFQTQNVLFANLRANAESAWGIVASTYYRGQFLKQRTNIGIINEGFNLLQFGYCTVGGQFRVSTTNYLDLNVVVPISALTFHKSEYALYMPAYVTLKYGVFW